MWRSFNSCYLSFQSFSTNSYCHSAARIWLLFVGSVLNFWHACPIFITSTMFIKHLHSVISHIRYRHIIDYCDMVIIKGHFIHDGTLITFVIHVSVLLMATRKSKLNQSLNSQDFSCVTVWSVWRMHVTKFRFLNIEFFFIEKSYCK